MMIALVMQTKDQISGECMFSVLFHYLLLCIMFIMIIDLYIFFYTEDSFHDNFRAWFDDKYLNKKKKKY